MELPNCLAVCAKSAETVLVVSKGFQPEGGAALLPPLFTAEAVAAGHRPLDVGY